MQFISLSHLYCETLTIAPKSLGTRLPIESDSYLLKRIIVTLYNSYLEDQIIVLFFYI